ncbi:MAG: hypothetical protein C4309_02005 [Chloroflexota bacterium]
MWRTAFIRAGEGDTVGESLFVVEVRNEKEKDHPGLELEGVVQSCAYLDVAQRPNFNTFAQGAVGGLAGAAQSVVELLAGMMQKLGKPKECADLQVTYHTNCIAALADLQSGAVKLDGKALDDLRKCLTFELKHEYRVERGGQGALIISEYESSVTLQFDPVDFRIKGQAPAMNTNISAIVSGGCAIRTTPGEGLLKVHNLEFIFGKRVQTDEVYLADLKLHYTPEQPTPEMLTFICPMAPPTSASVEGFTTSYIFPHELIEEALAFVARGWEIVGGEIYARTEWRNQLNGVSEWGRFTLYHRPEE